MDVGVPVANKAAAMGAEIGNVDWNVDPNTDGVRGGSAEPGLCLCKRSDKRSMLSLSREVFEKKLRT